MQKVNESAALRALRAKLANDALTPQQLSKLKGGNGNSDPLPPVQNVTEDYIEL